MEDVKPDVKPDAGNNVLNLVIRDAHGDQVQFKVKPTTKFGKIFDAYKARKGDLEGVRFQIDGQALQQDRTPADEDLQDGDIIDAMIEQLGG